MIPSSERSSKTLRILSLDGGGMRGYLSAHWLNLFIKEWGITEIWKHFDIISGTSIGGIQALAYANGLSPTDLFEFFEEDGPWIFTTRSILDVALGECEATSASSPPSVLNKIQMIGRGEPFYESVRNPLSGTCDIDHSNYGDFRLQKKLRSVFGDVTLEQLKTKVLITSYDQEESRPTFFSNIDLEGLSGQSFKVSDVALCTSAAPIYFPSIPLTHPVTLKKMDFIDGGVFQNNPSGLAYSVGQVIFPMSQKCCVLSIGTGRGDIGFGHVSAQEWQALGNLENTQGITGLMEVMKISMEAAQETIHQDMRWRSIQPFNNLSYYRFQVKLDESHSELDVSDPQSLQYFKNLASSHFMDPRNSEDIRRFISSLEI